MDLLSRPVLAADHRLAYGEHAEQFGDLWLPERDGPSPLVVFFHGGWWKSEYDLGYAGYLCTALKQAGVAVWSVEYRRVGTTGGGWPETFLDAAAGVEYITTLAKNYSLDLTRVIVMGHSAGGHLAFWIAGRHNIPGGSEISTPLWELPLRAVIALAGAIDLRLTVALAGDEIFAHDREEVCRLMGGSPEEVPDRYLAGNPGDLLPLRAPQYLFQGCNDDQIPPELPAQWTKLKGADAKVIEIAGAGHFDVVDPETHAWAEVFQTIQSILED